MIKIALIFFTFLFAGCGINDVNISFEEGNYSGTYIITQSNGITESGIATFSFKDNNYFVTPEKHLLPPNGAGSFNINQDVIEFIDTVPHTADFDWTLILNGKFEISKKDEILILKQKDTIHNRKRIISLIKLK